MISYDYDHDVYMYLPGTWNIPGYTTLDRTRCYFGSKMAEELHFPCIRGVRVIVLHPLAFRTRDFFFLCFWTKYLKLVYTKKVLRFVRKFETFIHPARDCHF